jgi:peptide-methionine (S)-S-oxide reductase
MSEAHESAVLAGGCYWTMQQLLRGCDGVVSTRVGWTGGTNDDPTEENNVGHAEAVEVTFDPNRVSYRRLLEFSTSSEKWPRRPFATSMPPAIGRERS